MLSLCAIVKNEQESIERMLASVRGVASQIVVVDTGSTDETRERAATAGAEVFQYKWQNSFADARNFSLSQAREPWILVLDADEALDPNYIATVRGLISGPPQTYWLHRRHYCTDLNSASSTTLPADHPATTLGARTYFTTHDIRLFPNRPDLRYQGAVHESIEEAAVALGLRPVDTAILIEHFGHLGSKERKEAKAEQYLTLAQAKASAAPHDWRNWYQLGIECQSQGMYANAIEYFHHAITLIADYSPLWRDLGISLYALGRKRESIENLSKALSLNPLCMIAWSSLGAIFLEEDALDEAKRCFNVIISSEPHNAFALSKLGQIKELRGRAGSR
jgi:glycosyltransferase involved in cell wall biosynthesis